MLTPSSNNPLPWSKRKVHSIDTAALWAIDDANGNEVLRLDDVMEGAEQTADFIVTAAKDFIVTAANATQSIVWEIDSRQKVKESAGP